MPSTIRIELNKAGFDWKTGAIIAEEGVGRQSSAGKHTRTIEADDKLLDQVFSNGNGVLDIPRVFARDTKAVYFAHAGKWSGTRILRVAINPEVYLKHKESVPYPGDD